MTPEEFKLAVRQLALDTGLADRDLSTGDQLISDYGPIDDEVMEFAKRILELPKV